jgi:hypothetical protein
MNNEAIFLKAQGRAAMLGIWFFGLSYAITGQIIPGIF